MGFEPAKIPLLRNAFRMRELNFVSFPPDGIQIVSNKVEWNKTPGEIDAEETFNFRPHFGWVGAVEREAKVQARHAGIAR
jgi:hypothetical protein